MCWLYLIFVCLHLLLEVTHIQYLHLHVLINIAYNWHNPHALMQFGCQPRKVIIITFPGNGGKQHFAKDAKDPAAGLWCDSCSCIVLIPAEQICNLIYSFPKHFWGAQNILRAKYSTQQSIAKSLLKPGHMQHRSTFAMMHYSQCQRLSELSAWTMGALADIHIISNSFPHMKVWFQYPNLCTFSCLHDPYPCHLRGEKMELSLLHHLV